MSNYFKSFDKHEDYCAPKKREYSRILTAAIVNEKFCKLLLANPELAIRNGFGGEAFHLAKDETERLSSIHAISLADFAKQIDNLASSPKL
jgi:hypothetical protein